MPMESAIAAALAAVLSDLVVDSLNSRVVRLLV